MVIVADILDTIDGALFDFATSKDAMRWQPPEDREPEAPPVEIGSGRIFAAGGDGEWTDIGYTGGGISFQLDTEAINEQIAALGRWIGGFARQMTVAINDGLEPFRKYAATVAMIAHVQQPGSHGHCRVCHPEQAPRPLAVDGHEYARRRKARQRRKRGH